MIYNVLMYITENIGFAFICVIFLALMIEPIVDYFSDKKVNHGRS